MLPFLLPHCNSWDAAAKESHGQRIDTVNTLVLPLNKRVLFLVIASCLSCNKEISQTGFLKQSFP